MKVTIEDEQVVLTIELKREPMNWPTSTELLEKFGYAMLVCGYPWDMETNAPTEPTYK